MIIAIDVSNDVTRSTKFYDEYGFTIPAAFDSEGDVAVSRFGVIATPTNYLVDGAGRIVWRHYGYRPGDEAEVRAQIEKLLAKP